MTIDELFLPGGIVLDIVPQSKKQLFQDLAAKLIETDVFKAASISARDVAIAVMERERLGSTGVGNGIAVPHARLEGLDRVHAIFARLQEPLDYEAVDDRPVDIVVMLVAPAQAGGDHLRALAQVSRLLRRTDMRERLRAAPTEDAVLALLKEDRPADAA